MKRIYTSLALTALCLSASAQTAIYVTKTNGVSDALAIAGLQQSFSSDGKTMFVNGTYSYPTSDIADITYAAQTNRLLVTFADDKASVINPFVELGVSVQVEGAHVTISNPDATTEITTELAGKTTNGSLTYNGSYKTTLVLNGVEICNPNGAAIDINCGKRVNLELKKGTDNHLVDGSNGSHKAALYCKGHLEIDKSGNLMVEGHTKHAIAAKEYIHVKNGVGTINILSSESDGIHAGQYFHANGGTFVFNNLGGDGIQAEASLATDYDEDFSDGSVNIDGGSFDFTLTTDDAAALKADGDINVTDAKSEPSISIRSAGKGSKGMKADGNVNINAGIIEMTLTGSYLVNDKSDDEGEPENTNSYKVFVALPTTGSTGGGGGRPGQSNYWTSVALYKADGTLVQQLSSTVSKTSSTGQTLSFYWYDFGQPVDGSYYFRSADYHSNGSGTTYTIQSQTFNAPSSGIDVYYSITNSYSTSGTVRTFTLSNVTSTFAGSEGVAESLGDITPCMGIKSDGDISINGGTISISNNGIISKSIKSNQCVTLNGGILSLSPNGDMLVNGSDISYSAGIKCTNFYGKGGELKCTTQGVAARAISTEQSLIINDGLYTIVNNGAGKQATSDNYTAKGLKADGALNLMGGQISITMTGNGGKGIKASNSLTIGNQTNGDGPILSVSTNGSKLGGTTSSGWGGRPGESSGGSSAKAIKAQGAIQIYGGELTISTTTDGAEGLESKNSIEIFGGKCYLKCYDDCINCSGIIALNNGIIVCHSTGNDAIDSNYGRTGAIVVKDATVFSYTSKGGAEMGLDCDGLSYVKITGNANIVALGGNQGGSSSSLGSSTQGYGIITTSTSYSATPYYTLANASGNNLLTFKLDNNVSCSCAIFSAAGMARSATHTIKSSTTAPTDATTEFHGIYLGSSATGTTSVTSFTSK